MARGGVSEESQALEPLLSKAAPPREPWLAWRDAWWAWSQVAGGERVPRRRWATLERHNLPEVPIRPVIERLWEAMDQRDDRQPLAQWLRETQRVTALAETPRPTPRAATLAAP